MSTIKTILNSSIAEFKKAKTVNPALDAELLLSYVIKQPKEFLYSHPEYQLSKKQISNFQFLISRRSRGEPTAYLTSQKEFYGLNFYVNKNVLIPRPDTEILIEEFTRLFPNHDSKIKIADIGTGSGCIAVTLAKIYPQAKIYASDISQKTLIVAEKNAKLHQVTKQVTFKLGNLLKPLQKIDLDVIVANLPYGHLAWKNNTSVESRGLAFEPAKALFTTESGLKLYRQLLKQLAIRRHQPPLILLEFDPRQTIIFKKIIKTILPQYKIKIIKDLASQNRLIVLNLR